MARRITMHNGRASKDGVYNVKHNDRNFDVDHAEHINPDLVKYNYRWHCYGDKHPEWTFEQAEQQAYNQLFKKGLEARNQRYINGHHKDKCLTMDEYRTAKSSCPEETIIQIGRAGDSVEPELLKSVCSQHIDWMCKTYPNFRLLDVAMHVDEPDAAPHMHVRGVWVGHDKDGNKIVGQGKALEEMGIDRPDMDKPKSRYNNAKQTFTAQCRAHLEALCQSRGIDIETERLEPSKTGLSLLAFKRQQEQQLINELTNDIAAKKNELQAIMNDFDSIKDIDVSIKHHWGKYSIDFDDKAQAETAQRYLNNVDNILQENAEAKKILADKDTIIKQAHDDALIYTSNATKTTMELIAERNRTNQLLDFIKSDPYILERYNRDKKHNKIINHDYRDNDR